MKNVIEAAADKIVNYMQGKETVDLWHMKNDLYLQASVFYMAAGFLVSAGRIKVEAEGINYTASLVK